MDEPTYRRAQPPAATAARQHLKRGGKLLTTRVENLEVSYSNRGLITAQEVARMIDPHVGPVLKLEFHRSPTAMPNSVGFTAFVEPNADGNVVTGALVLHAGFSEQRVVSWAEIELDKPAGPSARRASTYRRAVAVSRPAWMERQGRCTTWPLYLLLDATGALTPRDLERLLAAEFRPVAGVEFTPSGRPNVVRWSGDADGREVGGELRMRCAVREGLFVSSVQITIDPETLKHFVRTR